MAHTKETIEKIRESMIGKNKGKPAWNKGLTKETDEGCQKMSINHKGTKRHPLSEEVKEKIRKSLCVHHINGNHFDDRPENRIILTRGEHTRIHNLQRYGRIIQ